MKREIKEIPYTEEIIENFVITKDNSFDVSIRKYPKRYYIAYTYILGENYCGDIDDDDFMTEKTTVYAKILHSDFNKSKILSQLKEHLNRLNN